MEEPPLEIEIVKIFLIFKIKFFISVLFRLLHILNGLIFDIKKILRFSISKGGSSIRDFKDTLGKSGAFQQFFYVYGRENKNCSRISCKGKIKKIQISNRSSFYCNKCQG